VRAVLDPNVLISPVLSDRGASAAILRRWTEGAFELVASESLLQELETALGYPKLEKRVTPDERQGILKLLRDNARLEVDPAPAPQRSRDPADDYLLALAEQAHAVLVSGDRDLLDLSPELPVLTPRQFLGSLDD
jgi:putative PIN family toxin of toxin-antitoxin system